MQLSLFDPKKSNEITKLFAEVFTASANQEEGELISALVDELISTTNAHDLFGFVACVEENIVGCIFFSRLLLPSDQVAFLLSPVAVATDYQGQGVGQALINFGLEHLKSLDVELAFTYGDPNFYAKVGFKPISETVVKAPFPLSQPKGWLAQSINGTPIAVVEGASQCVEALAKEEYW